MGTRPSPREYQKAMLPPLREEFHNGRRWLISRRDKEWIDAHERADYVKENIEEDVLEGINEVDKFLDDTEPEIEKTHAYDPNWYGKMISKMDMLKAKRQPTTVFHRVSLSKGAGSSSSRTKPMKEGKALDGGVGNSKEGYQIFLSFRGEDTRYNFTGNLYHALRHERFKIFMDDRGLKRGDSISEVIMEAIRKSKLSIIVFSENFADSTWCLDEVVEILECREKRNQLVWPVFYKVEPSDVRHQRNSYEKAMVKQERRFGTEKVKKWRSTLSQVCSLNAFHYKENSGYERDFIKGIIKDANNIRDHL